MTKWVLIDFETASGCDLKKAGAWRYAEDPTTEILCLGFATSNDMGVLTAHELLSSGTNAGWLRDMALDPEVFFVAHNAAFEKAIWRRLMVPLYGFPDIPNSRWHDTLAMCALRVLPLDLDHAARVLSLGEEKDNAGSTFTKGLSKPLKDGSYDRSADALGKVQAYCLQDLRVETAMHRKLGWMPAAERNVWLLDQRINERGVKLDLQYIRAAQSIVEQASGPLIQEFRALTGGITPTQRDKFMRWLAETQRVVLPNLQKETVENALAGDLADDFGDPVLLTREAEHALHIRELVGFVSTKKLDAMLDCVCADGRAHGLLQYHGSGTGRWAGRIIQPQNFPKGSIKLGKKTPSPDTVIDAIMTGDPDYVRAVLGEPIEVVVGGLRHALTSETGRAFVVGDFAGIEARIVLALAGQHDKTALMASGKDVYLDMAEAIYEVSPGAFNKEEHPAQRQVGKISVLGLGFQMGAPKFYARYCADQSLAFAQRVVDAYRKTWAPEVPKLWRALENAALSTVMQGTPHEAYGIEYRLEEEWMTARLWSGRKLWYYRPTFCRKTMPWSKIEEPDIRPAWFYWAKKSGVWRRCDAFGGLLTENVVQAMARDLLVVSMFKCEKNDLPIVLTVHDENVTEPLERNANPLALEQIMCDRPEWAVAMKVPVAAECWAGTRYRK